MQREKNRLTILLGALLMAGFLVASLASYFVSRSSVRTQISESELPLTSDNVYSEIQRDLLRPVFISSLMASDTFLRDWVVQGEKDASKITRYLKEIKTRYNVFTSFFVSEKTRIYYQAKGILKKVEADEPRDIWYFRVRDMKAEYEINVDPDMANKDAVTIFINYRVCDYDGNFIGATGVGLKVHSAKRLIEDYQNRYGSNIYFIDRKGMIRLHGPMLPPDVHSISDMEGIGPLFERIVSSDKNSFRYTKTGRVVHVNTRYIPEVDWYLVVERSEEKDIKNILRTLFVTLLICLVITAGVVAISYRTITAYQSRLEKAATTDELTGMYNRHALDIVLDETIKECRRTGDDFSLIMIDIDHFKKINDEFGHLAGDEVLKHMVCIFKKSIRKSDVCCRWGGEEFLVLLRKCAVNNGYNIAEKIRKTIEKSPCRYDGKEILATVSLGISQFKENDSADDLIGRADHAMYRAKQNGRNRSEMG